MKIRKISAWLCLILLITLCGCGKTKEANVKPQPDSKAYRNVKITDISGNATLTRDKKQHALYKQMIIKDDDNIVTMAESSVDLLLDSDKYAHIYENSDVTFRLEGNTSKGAIRIYLNKGRINNKIENKLSANDNYEVHTPDAVMAVRGTEFEVEVTDSDNGRQTQVTTQSGSVEVTLPNGEQRLNAEGETVIIETPIDGNGNVGDPRFKDEEDDIPPRNTDTTPPKTENPPPKNETPPVQQPNVTTPVEKVPLICVKCSENLNEGDTHLLSCAEGHYSCDGKDHGLCADCQKNFCDSSVHELLECGKHYLCNLSDKETVIHDMFCAVCNTYACNSEKSHDWATCGCVSCVGDLGENHIMCEFCYTCTSDGQAHGDGVCNIELQ